MSVRLLKMVHWLVAINNSTAITPSQYSVSHVELNKILQSNISMCTCLPTYPPTYLWTYLPTWLPARLLTHPPTYLTACRLPALIRTASYTYLPPTCRDTCVLPTFRRATSFPTDLHTDSLTCMHVRPRLRLPASLHIMSCTETCACVHCKIRR